MKANVLYNIGDLRYTNVEIPILKSGEALIRVMACGICGSDIARVFKTGTYHFPTIIGHEFSGEVCKVSEEKHSQWIGKRVTVFPLKPCFCCDNCKSEKYELCTNYDYLGSRCNGGFSEYAVVPIWNLMEIPDEIDFETAAMMEPATVAMHALEQSRFKSGDTIAVIGPGTIGIILCKLALILGADKVFLIGRTPAKLDFARSYGITDVCNSTETDTTEWINQKTGHKGVDIAFEGTGVSDSFNNCLDMVKASGTIVALGNPTDNILLNKNSYWKLLRKQLSIYGTWNSRYGSTENNWVKILKLLQKKELALSPLITHRLPFNCLSEGLAIMQNKEIYSNKVMLVNNEK